MEKLIINNEGIFVQVYNDNLKRVELERVTSEIQYHYNDLLELSDDLTFGKLFEALEVFLDEFDRDFMADTRKWPLKPYFDWVKKDKKDEEQNLTEIFFEWVNDCMTTLDRKSGKNQTTWSSYLAMSALGKDESGEIITYSTSFVDLCDLKDLPVKIRKICTLDEYNSNSGETKKLFEYDSEVTFREFLSALFHEITFYGSPDTQKEERDEIFGKENFFDGMTEEEMMEQSTPFYEIQLEWLDEELKEALAEENFEWAKRVQDEIDLVKKENDLS